AVALQTALSGQPAGRDPGQDHGELYHLDELVLRRANRSMNGCILLLQPLLLGATGDSWHSHLHHCHCFASSLDARHSHRSSSRGASRSGGNNMSLTISSSSFPNGGEIPKKFTCDGADVSPHLSWNEPPAGTKSF